MTPPLKPIPAGPDLSRRYATLAVRLGVRETLARLGIDLGTHAVLVVGLRTFSAADWRRVFAALESGHG